MIYKHMKFLTTTNPNRVYSVRGPLENLENLEELSPVWVLMIFLTEVTRDYYAKHVLHHTGMGSDIQF